MAVTISLDSFSGESESTVEAKVRNLPANQGLNDYDMWVKIDAEIAAVKTAQASLFKSRMVHINPVDMVNGHGHTGNRHGNK